MNIGDILISAAFMDIILRTHPYPYTRTQTHTYAYTCIHTHIYIVDNVIGSWTLKSQSFPCLDMHFAGVEISPLV